MEETNIEAEELKKKDIDLGVLFNEINISLINRKL